MATPPRIGFTVPKGKGGFNVIIDQPAIGRWSREPGQAPLEAARNTAELVAGLARDLVGVLSGNLRFSIRVIAQGNQFGSSGYRVVAGGVTETTNASGIDYAGFHHDFNPFLEDAINAVPASTQFFA